MKSKIKIILIIGFLLRLLFLIIDQFIVNLPQSGSDTERFKSLAIELMNTDLNILIILNNGALLFPYFGSLLYNIVGVNPFLWAFVLLLFGIGTIYNIYKTVLLITNDYNLANKSAWIAALFPNLVVLSVILLRESPMHYFVSLGIYYLINFIKYNKLYFMIGFVLSTLFASLFHSSLIIIIMGFILYIIIYNKKANIIIKLIAISLSVFFLYYMNTTGFGLDKIGGSFDKAFETITSGGDAINAHANTNYPNWLLLKGNVSDLLITPIRTIAFLCAPFLPLLVKSNSHIIGLIDGIIYFYLLVLIYKNRNILLKNEMTKSLIVIIFVTSFALSFGASNFGTNIRHRAKILPIILMIPLFSKKERYFYFQNLKNEK